MVTTNRRRFIRSAGVVAVGVTAGCVGGDDGDGDGDGGDGDGDGGGGDGGDGDPSKTELSVLTSYFTDTSYSGIVVADRMGYFDDVGLDVTVDYSTEVQPIQVLEQGDYDIIVSAHLDPILGQDRGIDAQAFVTTQSNIVQSYGYDADKNDFSGVEDFVGQTVGLQNDIDVTIPHEEIVKNELTEEQRNNVETTFVGYDVRNLLTGQVDFLTKFPTNVDGIAMEHAGEANFGYVNMMDYLDLPGNASIAMRSLMEDHPNTVREFTRAHVRGLRDSMDPDMRSDVAETLWTDMQERGIDDLIRGDVDAIPVIEDSLEMFVDFRHMDAWDDNGVGWNPPERIMYAQELFEEAGQIENPSSEDELVNNQFIDEVTDDNGDLVWDV